MEKRLAFKLKKDDMKQSIKQTIKCSKPKSGYFDMNFIIYSFHFVIDKFTSLIL